MEEQQVTTEKYNTMEEIIKEPKNELDNLKNLSENKTYVKTVNDLQDVIKKKNNIFNKLISSNELEEYEKFNFYDKIKYYYKKFTLYLKFLKEKRQTNTPIKNKDFIYYSIRHNDYIKKVRNLMRRMDLIDEAKYQYKRDVSLIPQLYNDLTKINGLLKGISSRLYKYEKEIK